MLGAHDHGLRDLGFSKRGCYALLSFAFKACRIWAGNQAGIRKVWFGPRLVARSLPESTLASCKS